VLTFLECLAKADGLATRARDCTSPELRNIYVETAQGWRRTAILARHQEAWHARHQDAYFRGTGRRRAGFAAVAED
jgi:hypothetical protein